MQGGIANLRGVITSLVTPFDARGRVDEETLRREVEHQISSGVHGLCPVGGTGEPLSMTEEEVLRVAEVTLDQARRRVPVVVGAMGVSTDQLARFGRKVAEQGAAAIMMVAPYFVRAAQDHALRHFVDVASEADLPIVVFNTPSRSGVQLPLDFMTRLRDATDRFVAIKESTGSIAELQAARRALSDRVRLLQGSDALFFATLAVGGDGGILALANLCPKLLVRVYDATARGDLATARGIQERLLGIADLLYRESHPSPLKAAMALVGRPVGRTRRPLYAPSPGLAERLAAEVERIAPE